MALPEKILLSAPCAFNLAEASRLVEIAMALEHHPKARGAFAVHLISDGGDFEDFDRKARLRVRLEWSPA